LNNLGFSTNEPSDKAAKFRIPTSIPIDFSVSERTLSSISDVKQAYHLSFFI